MAIATEQQRNYTRKQIRKLLDASASRAHRNLWRIDDAEQMIADVTEALAGLKLLRKFLRGGERAA